MRRRSFFIGLEKVFYTMSPVFQAQHLKFSFGIAPVIKDVSFDLFPGDALIVAGRSGCGKSAFLELCAGLLHPQSGKVLWEGKCISEFTQEEFTEARQRTGFVFQKHALIHNFTIFDNIALPLRYHTAIAERDIRAKVNRLMEELGLFAVDHKFPNELSLGQAKCAALARALIMDPCIVFADEPTAGVDPFTGECIARVINTVRMEKRPVVIISSNDRATIRSMQCPVKILDNGELIDIREGQASTDELRPVILKALQEML
jgi:phospholipid/cholesterol/gamma-HCH transport system ATP-binding protein